MTWDNHQRHFLEMMLTSFETEHWTSSLVNKSSDLDEEAKFTSIRFVKLNLQEVMMFTILQNEAIHISHKV